MSTLALGGGITGEDGVQHPAVWRATDGATFTAPEDPFTGAGSVVALAPSDAGLVAAGHVYPNGESRPAVAVRDDSGRWAPAQLPPGTDDMTIRGVAASGATVVVTGAVRVSGRTEATALVSTDGGLTFRTADASPFSGGGSESTAIGDVTAVPTGFIAAACAPGTDDTVTALATSTDGGAWQRVDIDATYADNSPFLNVGAICSSLAIGPDWVLVGAFDLSPCVLSLDFQGQGRCIEAPRGSEQRSIDVPLAAWTGERTVVVSRESGGFTAALEDNGSAEGTATGLPVGAPAASDVLVATTGQRLVAGIARFPVVTEGERGGYSWRNDRVWMASTDGRTWGEDERSPSGALHIGGSEAMELAWGMAADAADDRFGGPAGGTEVWVRPAGGSWESLGIVAGGAGGEYLADIAAVPGGFVAVGEATIRDPDTGVYTTLPLAMASTDGRTWGNEQPRPTTEGSFDRACPLPTGGVLAVGVEEIGGADVPFLALRSSDGSWSPVDPAALPAGLMRFDECLPGNDALTLVATVDERPVVVRTTDGATFTAFPQDGPGFANASFTALARAGTTLLAAGTSSGGVDDPALWTSPDGQRWQRLGVSGLGGAGAQMADDVDVVGGTIVVAGRDRGTPVVWRVPRPS